METQRSAKKLEEFTLYEREKLKLLEQSNKTLLTENMHLKLKIKQILKTTSKISIEQSRNCSQAESDFQNFMSSGQSAMNSQLFKEQTNREYHTQQREKESKDYRHGDDFKSYNSIEQNKKKVFNLNLANLKKPGS